MKRYILVYVDRSPQSQGRKGIGAKLVPKSLSMAQEKRRAKKQYV